ncbi:MAG: GNAT family N-acetyltransferase [Candidatus Eisenbacteria bacterium]|nr:GNAT family N-acetyltransferase [Candidatus Eisenbacteria bacterium]
MNQPARSPASDPVPTGAPSSVPVVGDRFVAIEVQGEAALLEHLAGWEALVDAAVEPNLFLEPWMVLPALQGLSGKRPVSFLLIYEPPRSHLQNRRLLVGLVPLERTRFGGAVRRPVLQLWRHRFAYLTTPLLHRECAREAFAAVLDWLEREAGGMVRLPMWRAEGPVHEMLIEELNTRGWPFHLDDVYTRAYLRRGSGGDAYLERSMDAKRRRNLRRLGDRLREAGTVEICTPGADDKLESWVEEFLRLEASGWKGAAGSAFLSRDADADFLRRIAAAANQRGRLEFMALRFEGRPIALKLNLWSEDGRRGYAYRIAFDEEFAKFSPGMLLELENIQRFHDRPAAVEMDSCASRNRFLLNHLWRERLTIETLWLAPAGRAEFWLRAIPLLRWLESRLFRRRGDRSNREE